MASETSNFWSQDRLLAACCGSTITVFNTSAPSQQSLILEGRSNTTIHSAAWSRNGRALAFDDGPMINLYYASNGQHAGLLPQEGGDPAYGKITCCRITSDSKGLVFGCQQGQTVFWDFLQARPYHTYSDHRTAVTSIALSDGLHASASVDGGLVARSGTNTVLLAEPNARRNAHRSMWFNPVDPGLLGSISLDNSINLWGLGGVKQNHIKLADGKHTDTVTGLAFSRASASAVLTCGLDKQLLIWDRRKPGDFSSQITLPQPLTSIGVHDDGYRVAVGSTVGAVYLLDVRYPTQPATSLQCAERQPVLELSWQYPKESRQSSSKQSSSSAAHSQAANTAAAAAAVPVTRSAANTVGNAVKAHIPATSTTTLSTQASRVKPGLSSSLDGSASDLNPRSSVASQSSLQDVPLPPATNTAAGTQVPTYRRSGSINGQAAPQPLQSATQPVSASTGTLENTLQSIARSSDSQSIDGTATVVQTQLPVQQQAVMQQEAAKDQQPQQPTAGAKQEVALSESAFKEYMNDVVDGLKNDIRNMHIEMVRQFHIQQVEIVELVAGMMLKQQEQSEDIKALKATVERLTRQQGLQAWL